MMRLLRPPHSGIFLRSFPLHGPHHARETIAEICSLWAGLATAIISQTGSWLEIDHELDPAAAEIGVRVNDGQPARIDAGYFGEQYVLVGRHVQVPGLILLGGQRAYANAFAPEVLDADRLQYLPKGELVRGLVPECAERIVNAR